MLLHVGAQGKNNRSALLANGTLFKLKPNSDVPA